MGEKWLCVKSCGVVLVNYSYNISKREIYQVSRLFYHMKQAGREIQTASSVLLKIKPNTGCKGISLLQYGCW